MFENRVLRKIFGSKRDEVRGSGEDYTTRSLMLCTYQISLWWSNQDKLNGRSMWNMGGGKRGAYVVLVGNRRERYRLKDLIVDRRILLKMYLQKI